MSTYQTQTKIKASIKKDLMGNRHQIIQQQRTRQITKTVQ